MSADSAELNAFTDLYSDLKEALQSEIGHITDQAFSKRLISKETKRKVSSRCSNADEAERTGILLDSLHDKIKRDPKAYHRFTNILVKIDVYADLAERMKVRVGSSRSYDSHREQHSRPHRGNYWKAMITVTVIVASICGLVLYMYMYSGLPIQNQPNFCVSEMEVVEEDTKRELDLYYEPLPQQNLPEINGPFYGRANELKKLKGEVLSNLARIISINGPPAFGKSTMAIKLGHELRKSISDVRYIDTESTRSSWFLCISKTFHRSFDSSSQTHVGVNSGMPSGNSNGLSDNDNLCDWSEKLEKRTVLILDNCDHILHSNHRKQFLTIIKKHLHNPFITIILTSQEKLLFLDSGFVSVNVGEFSQEHSRKMLQHYVADLTDQESDELALAVGHCPLALKVVGKLLSIKGRDYVESLLSDLKERVVDTISEDMTVEEEKFRAIMDYSYKKMNEETQDCARLLSLFPGSTAYGMEKQILAQVINSSCIHDVVRISFIEEVLINKKPRHSMHKLIRDYFKSVYLAYPRLQQFNTSYITYYSEYLKGVMKRAYAGYQISDEERYTILYLETHNIDYFSSTVVSTNKDDELKANTAIALGLLIQEKFTHTLALSQEILLEAFDSYKNVSVFARLCSITSQKVCANILWSTVSILGVPDCNAPASHFSDVLLFLTNMLSPSLTWFDDGTFCSVLFTCDNIHSFVYKNTINVIVAEPSEKPLYDVIQRGIALCGIRESYIFTVIFILIFLKECFHYPRETVPPFAISVFLCYLATTFFTAEFIDPLMQMLPAALNSSVDACSYSNFERKVSMSKGLFLYLTFNAFLPNFISSTLAEFLCGLFCVLASLRISLISSCTFHFIISPLFFLTSLVYNLILLFVPSYLFRRFSSNPQFFPRQKNCVSLFLKMTVQLPLFLILLAAALQVLSQWFLFTIDQLNIADVAHTSLSTVSETHN